jgi:hypothetical protein
LQCARSCVKRRKFSGQAATPEQLDRNRRLGTVLGALLFAGGGLALAITVDLSIGLQLVDVERVRPWAVIRAALGNAAVVLGLSTAAESLYWVWRELGFRGRVLDWAPGPSEPGTSIDRVAHLGPALRRRALRAADPAWPAW